MKHFQEFQELSTPPQTTFVSIDSLPKISPDLVTLLFKSANNVPLVLSVLAFILLSVANGRSKSGKLATSKFGGRKEKQNAATVAKKQLREKKRSAVTLYVGNPLYNKKLMYLPEAQRGNLYPLFVKA